MTPDMRLAVQQLPTSKNNRRSHHKSRSGCITCKIRRKKCDELRPSCRRCTSTGRKCDGYDGIAKDVQMGNSPSQRVSEYSTLRRSPKFQRPRAGAQSSQNDLGILLPLISLPRHSLLETNDDYASFNFFCRMTVPQFSSYFDSPFWKTSLLQRCSKYPAVQQAAMAVGAIHRSHDFGSSTHIGENDQYAVQAYAKALRLLREALDTPDAFEIGLIVSILLAAFESFQDNYPIAAQHFLHGLKVTFSLKSPKISSGLKNQCPALNERSLRDLLRKAKRLLQDVFDREPLSNAGNISSGFDTLDGAYDSLFSLWCRLSHVMETKKGHIDYEYHSESLRRWTTTFTRFSAGSIYRSERVERQHRCLRLFYEAIYLLLLTRANGCDEVDLRSNMSESARYNTLNVHFSKLGMLLDVLSKDPDSLTHLSSGKLQRFSTTSGLMKMPDKMVHGDPISTSKAYQVAEGLVAMEEDVIVTSGLLQSGAMWVDLTTSLEDGRVTVRYCIQNAAGEFTWMHEEVNF